MATIQFLAAVPVREVETSVPWYERLLGQPATNRPMEELAEWYPGGDSGLQLVADQQRAGSGLLTISVDDIAQFVVDARERGIVIGEISPGEMASVVTVADPDGNAVTIAQPGMAGT